MALEIESGALKRCAEIVKILESYLILDCVIAF